MRMTRKLAFCMKTQDTKDLRPTAEGIRAAGQKRLLGFSAFDTDCENYYKSLPTDY
jgi:hypothetical protein